MISTGIRIFDDINRVVSVNLQDILEEIHNGENFVWSILYFQGIGRLQDGKSIPVFENEVRYSERGILIKWDELNKFDDTLDQIIDIVIIGCKDLEKIARYEEDKDMYENCDIVISMCDSTYWEVFSHDRSFIERLAVKFKDVELRNLQN